MQQVSYNKPAIFSDRKVSIELAMKVLKNNGINANADEAKVILDFLYLFAKVYENSDSSPKGKSNTEPLSEPIL
ncbi:hypothetical protein MUY27_02455 [Mucilaginibacter sp. RS28]|uniref:PTS sugar transporter subunit IIBC n=1 Tax=Mucilaginibacter straminoryzae TaxID=2932774 RepID=A0A9X1X014_9SPHI|nr:hypothetical protein [Mucilaginibacter straminoryzae]MCJ8208553.1 hypothetical protein [Mucilaginibacter straminoryzae]